VAGAIDGGLAAKGKNFEQKLTKNTKEHGLRFAELENGFAEGPTLTMSVFLHQTATGGVPAACGLCDLCVLLFKIIISCGLAGSD
jgi:hypothetical protein